MSRLTDNDRSFGPFTWGKWTNSFSIKWGSGGEEEDTFGNHLRIVAFGWVLQISLPSILRPWKEKHMALSWSEEDVKRMGRNWYYNVYPREYGFSLSNMGNGYDFLQVFFGPQTHDSSTTKSWCKHLPWKQWRHVRFSLYDTEGKHFWSELDRNRKRRCGFADQTKMEELVPKAHFSFEDYDGARIIATTRIQEREWHKGEGWFKWLRFLNKPMIRRSLDLRFSDEVGPQKGSWKGGTIGHSTDMLPGETPEQAFRRYCEQDHERKGRKFNLRFIGPCDPPPPKPKYQESASDAETNMIAKT